MRSCLYGVLSVMMAVFWLIVLFLPVVSFLLMLKFFIGGVVWWGFFWLSILTASLGLWAFILYSYSMLEKEGQELA